MFPNLIRPAGFGIAAVSGGGGGGSYSTTIAALQTSAGMTQIVSTFADDASRYLPDVGFNFPIYGSIYRSNISIGSNWYLLFGLTSSAYSGLSRTVPGQGLLFGADDRSWQNVYFKAESGFCRIRFEGYVTSGGSSYTAIFQIKLFADGTIELAIGIGCFYNPAALTLVQTLTKGDGITYTDFTVPAGSTAQSDFTSTAALTSLVFRPVDAAGNSHTVQVGSYSYIAPVVPAGQRNTNLLNAISYAALNNADYSYYDSVDQMPQLYDGDLSKGMMGLPLNGMVFVQVQLSASSFLNKITLYLGQFNGAVNMPDAIKIYSGLVTPSTTDTPIYSGSLAATALAQDVDLTAVAALNSPFVQITIAFIRVGQGYSTVAVNEMQLKGHGA